MKYSDYPHTLALLKKQLPSITQIRPSHGAALAVINTVRTEVDLPAIDIDELIMATLGRIEDKIATDAPD